jgi:hypothetical protein
MGNALNQNPGEAQEASFNGKNIAEEDLALGAVTVGTSIAADCQPILRGSTSDIYVRTSLGEVGIYHPEMLRKFSSGQTPRRSNLSIVDHMRKEIDFCSHAQERYAQSCDEVFRLLGKFPAPEQQESKTFIQAIDEISRREAQRLGLSPEATEDYVNQETFRALEEKYQGSPLGSRAGEAYALGNYTSDAMNRTAARKAVPLPGQGNPYNTSGRSYYDHREKIHDSAIRIGLQRQEVLQLLNMVSLFNNCSMGLVPFAVASWMH